MTRPDSQLNLTEANSWSEYRRLVTQGLKDLDDDIKTQKRECDQVMRDLAERFEQMRLQMTVDITTLKTKAGLWGGIIGAVVAFLTVFVTEAVIKK
jgi:hypothetical protein